MALGVKSLNAFREEFKPHLKDQKALQYPRQTPSFRQACSSRLGAIGGLLRVLGWGED